MKHVLKQFFRSPKVIIGEIVAMALLCAVGAALPQVGTGNVAEFARLHESGSLMAGLVRTLSLDDVFHSAWFLVGALLATTSLFFVVVDQLKRLRAQWSRRLTPVHFRGAPLRAEFERPARLGLASCARPACVQVWTERRLGLAGSAVFHSGLLLVILAGALKALFGSDAVVDLMEEETLLPTAKAWAAQWPGVFGQPVSLNLPVTLKAVKATRYQDGDLRELKVSLEVRRKTGPENTELAVNHDVRVARERLFLSTDFGVAALIEWRQEGLPTFRQAALLAEQGPGRFDGSLSGPEGLRAHLRAQVGPAGDHPTLLEVRVMKGNALVFTGDARVGDTVLLPTGGTLSLCGTPFWARLRGSHDAWLWLAYVGFALVVAGVTLIFTWVKVDGCVVVTPAGTQERVLVALKPQRLTPLFRERFERLVREQGGPGTPSFPAQSEEQAAEAMDERIAQTPGLRAIGPRSAAGVRLPAPRLAGGLCLLFCAVALSSCRQSSVNQARQLVERYNHVVSEAYRRGDVRLIDPVVGPKEGKKLAGLIGVRLDLGLTLDSQLLAFEVTGVETSKDEMRVQTKERWRYRDLKIGSGLQVGEESLDSYQMLYLFKKSNRVWLVDEIRFTAAPQVGRQRMAWMADRSALHGVAGAANEEEVKQP